MSQVRLKQLAQESANDGEVVKWSDSNGKWEPGTGGAGGGDVSSDGTTSVAGEVPTYTDTGQKEIGRSDILFGSSSPTVGTRTLGATSTMAGGRITTDGTIAATGNGSVALGIAWDLGGTPSMTSSGNGSLCGGLSFASGGTSTMVSSANGSFLWGAASQGEIGTATLQAIGVGSFAGGYCFNGSTIETASGTYGAFAHGYAVNGGIIRCVTSGGTFAVGYSTGSGTSIISSGSGAFSTGYATGGGDILASGDGGFAGGYASTNATTASGDGSFAWGDCTSGDITASATNSAQLGGPGVNDIAGSLQVGDTTDGVRLIAGGTTSTINGSIWVDGSGNVIIRSGGSDVTIA